MEGAIDGLVRVLGMDFVLIAADFIHGLDLARVSPTTVKRRFKSLFGVSPRHCAFLWLHCADQAYEIDPSRDQIHLLWTLNLLKTNDTEHVLHGRWCADEKTIRKWTRIFLEVLSTMKVVNFDCRKDRAFTQNKIYITVDGTDFRIKEPSPFSPTWFSHKFKGAGVRYEVGICIATGWIVWVHGPWRCGSHSDETIARLGLHHVLEEGEKYIADGGYKSLYAVTPDDSVTQQEMDYMSICRTRHETVNRLFKLFASVGNTFTRRVDSHALFCHSIINIVQVGIMHKEINPFAVQPFEIEPTTWPANLDGRTRAHYEDNMT